MSEGVVANKHDARFTVGYEVEPGRDRAAVYQDSKRLSIFGRFQDSTLVKHRRGKWGLT